MTVWPSAAPSLRVRPLLFILGLIAVGIVSAGAQSQPHVHLVATGGAISNPPGGRLTAEELAKSMPGLDKVATLSYEQFANVASSQLTMQQWLSLSRRVNALLADDKGLAG